MTDTFDNCNVLRAHQVLTLALSCQRQRHPKCPTTGGREAHLALTQKSTADKMNEHREASKAMLSKEDSGLQKDQNGVVSFR